MSKHVAKTWEDWDASQDTWCGEDFEKCNIRKSFFDETDCTEISFTRCDLDRVDFSLSYMWEALFAGCALVRCKFDKAKLKGANFESCTFDRTEFFAPEHGDSLAFVGCNFVRCKFIGMMDFDFNSIKWINCTFDVETMKCFPDDFKRPSEKKKPIRKKARRRKK